MEGNWRRFHWWLCYGLLATFWKFQSHGCFGGDTTLRPFEAGVKSAFAQLNREPMRSSDMFECLSCEWP